MFNWLGLQGHLDGSSVRNMFEYSCTEEGTGAVKDIFEGGFKSAASEARKKFDIITSALHKEEERSASPSTQEHQKLEGKLKHRLK